MNQPRESLPHPPPVEAPYACGHVAHFCDPPEVPKVAKMTCQFCEAGLPSPPPLIPVLRRRADGGLEVR